MKARYSIGGKEVAYEEWNDGPRLPEILSKEECEAFRGPDKEITGREGWWILPLFLLSLGALFGMWWLS